MPRFRHNWRLGACYFRGHDGYPLVAQLDDGVVLVKLRLVSWTGEVRLEGLYLFEGEQNVSTHASHDNSTTRLSECRASTTPTAFRSGRSCREDSSRTR